MRQKLILLIALALVACSSADPIAEIRQLHDERRYAESIKPLEVLLQRNPGDADVNHLYGVALMAIGEPALAIWSLRKAAEASPGNLERELLLARAHLLGGSAPDAILAADRVLEQAPDLLEALLVRIEARMATSQAEEALVDIDFVLEHEPNQPTALVHRVVALLELERIEEAQEAIAQARVSLETRPETRAWRARFCAVEASFIREKADSGHIEAAEEAWETCLETFPTDLIVVGEAVRFFDEQGDPERSTEALRHALELEPDNLELRTGLAQRLATRGQLDEVEGLLLEVAQEKDDPRIWDALARLHIGQENLAKARIATERMFELLPATTPLQRFMYADLLIRLEDFEAAERAIALIEAPELTSLLRGRLLLRRGEPGPALESLEEGIRLWPSNDVARQLAAEAAEQLGDFDRAAAEYKEAIRIDASNWEALRKLARLQEALGRPGAVQQLVGRYVRTQPNDLRGQRLYIHIAIKSGRPNLAADAIEKLSSIPGGRSAAIAETASIQRVAKPGDAVELIEKSGLDLSQPWNAEVLEVMIEALSELGRHPEAIAHADRAAEAQPGFAEFHRIRALALQSAGASGEEVRQALTRALELEPERPATLMALGSLSAGSGRVEEAVAFYDRAAAADPEDPQAAWAAAQLLASHGHGGGAGVDLRLDELLAAHGHHAGAANLRARGLVERGGNLEQAKELAQRALRLGGRAEALDTLGSIELERGEPEAAIALLRRSLDARPSSASTRYRLSRALARAGDAQEARRQLEKALEDGPFPEEEQARADLARMRR